MVQRLEDDFLTTKLGKILEIIRELRRIVLLFLVIVLFVVLGWFDISIISYVDWIWQGSTRFALLGFLIGNIILYIPSKYIVKGIYNPETELILAIDAAPSEEDDLMSEWLLNVECWELGTELMDELTVEGEELVSWRGFGGIRCHLAEEYDPVENKAVTTFHDELDSAKLSARKDAIDALRFRNNKWVKIGRILYSRFPTIVEKIESQFWQNKTTDVMKLLDWDNETVLQQVEESIREEADKTDDNRTKQQELDLNINVNPSNSDSEEQNDEN